MRAPDGLAGHRQSGGGEFSSVEQSGGMVETATPYDGELARLNRALTETAVPYGSADKRARVLSKAKHSLEAPAAAQAERAGWFGFDGLARSPNAAVSEGDLLDDVASKRVDLNRVEGSERPKIYRARLPPNTRPRSKRRT